MNSNHKALFSALRALSDCEVRLDSITRKIYSVDASIYELEPLGILLPKTRSSLQAAIEISNSYNMCTTVRGAATGITGACLGKGIIIDTSKYLKSILKIDWEKLFAYVEPGVIQDELNKALAPKGYRLGPDTSTGDRATIGGMAGNNSAGSHSLLYGKMVDAVQEVELILSGGEAIVFNELTENQWLEKLGLPGREGGIYRQIEAVRKEYGEEINTRFPKLQRRVSGYNLDELMKPFPLNLAKLIVGSEGTLGVISKLKLAISQRPKHSALSVIFFSSLQDAMRAIMPILKHRPIALELVDEKIIEAGKKSPSMRNKLEWLQHDRPFLAAEFQAEGEKELKEILDRFSIDMGNLSIGQSLVSLYNPKVIAEVWELRKAGLGLLLSKRSYSRAIAFIEDLSIPPENLESFIGKFLRYLDHIGKQAGIYGHAGSGCMHIRPYIDVRSEEDLKIAKRMMVEISDLVLEVKGSMSGEHGDGLLRSWLNEKMFGPKLYQAFKRVKSAFDPYNLMNPGKVVDGQPFEQNLRFNPNIPIKEPATMLSFSREGGIALSADLCNGNGRCRKKEGVMCPSFQVTGDEYDSTRARANAFRAVFKGSLHPSDLANEELHAILKLCIECKGCKTECPSQVDMAKMKAEALYHYQKAHGFTFQNRLFAHITTLFKWASPISPLFNSIKDFPFLKALGGISAKRSLPKLAPRFSKWFEKLKQPEGKPVVLFNDSYTEFLHPEIGKAAVSVLNALGYQVIVPPWSCCGRPFISKGFLKQAKEKAVMLAELLLPYAHANIPIVGLEPSCILTIGDEYRDLLDPELNSPLFAHSYLFDSFIAAHLENGKLPLSFNGMPKKVKIHGHCHQKSLIGMKPTLNVLHSIPQTAVYEIPSGCCGMAGSFGYEEEHYDFSMQIGELVLLKEVRESSAGTHIIADGFSCRTQIADGAKRKAVHLAEFLAECLKL